MPLGHLRAVVFLVRAQAHGATVPGHLAHVGQRPLQEAAARRERQQAHARRDPLLRLAALAHRHEELDGAVHHARAIGIGHRQERDDDVQALLAFLRPVVHLLGHGREGALGAALDHGTHRVHGCGLGRSGGALLVGHGGGVHFKHRAQDAVRTVRGQALEARAPGLKVQALEVVVGVVGRDVDSLGNGRVHKRLHRLHHGDVVLGRHLKRRNKVLGQLGHIAAQLAVQAPGMVFHSVFGHAAVGLALLALVHPRERRLDAVGRVVGKGQAHGAGGRNRQQVAVADAVRANLLLQRSGQTAGEGAIGQVAGGVECGEGALLACQFHRGAIGAVAHVFGNARGHGAALGAVIAQAQHGQGIAHAGEAHADAALGLGFGVLLRQWPVGDVEHVVERTHLQGHRLGKRLEVERRHAIKAKGVAHKARQDDGAEVAAPVRRQGLLAAGVGGGDLLAIAQVVVLVDVVQEQDAGFGEVVGRLHDGVPQLARGQGLVHPQAVGALVGALLHHGDAGAGLVHQLPGLVVDHGLDEGIAHAHRHVEVVPAARRALGGDEVMHIGVVDAQHAHLRTAARARAFDGGARLVEHIDVAARARRHRVRALDLGAARADAREVVAHATTTAHGFGGFAQGLVNAGEALVVHALNAVTHGLHKAVDQRGLDVGARRAHDAPGANGARVHVRQKQGLVLVAFGLGFDRSQRPRHAPEQVFGTGFARLEVFFLQHIEADGLGGRDIVCAAQVFSLHGSNPVDFSCGKPLPAACAKRARRAGEDRAPITGQCSVLGPPAPPGFSCQRRQKRVTR